MSSVHYGVALRERVLERRPDGLRRRRRAALRRGAFTRALDVIGHELTHGVTQYTAGLVYSKQPGALNEHFSDVFGSLVKQYALGQTAAEADWLIGAGIAGAAASATRCAR